MSRTTMVAVLVCTCLRALGAQAPAAVDSLAGRLAREAIAAGACVESLPPTVMRRTAARLVMRSEATRDTAVAFAIAFLTEDLGVALRTRLGGSDSTLAEGDAHLSWPELPTVSIAVTLRPGGFAWRAAAGTPAGAVQMLGPLLDSLVATPPAVAWPESAERREIRARLTFVVPSFDAEGRALMTDRAPAENGPVVFTLPHPWHTPALIPAGAFPRLAYPDFARQKGIGGTLRMVFMIGRDGRAIPGTIREAVRPTFATVDADLAEAYDRFRRSVETAIARQRFVPASVGGCTIASMLQHDFTFGFRAR